MSSCCRTCDNRNHAVNAFPAPPSQLDVSLITLNFKSEITSPHSRQQDTLNEALNNVNDNFESFSQLTSVILWSPCLSNPNTAVVITTASLNATLGWFDSLKEHLTSPPLAQHIYLDHSILSLATTSPEDRIACDIIQLQAPNPGVAAAIGKHFGWDPKRSSLSLQMASCQSAGFSRPGDLIKDFWAWAELHHEDPISPSTVGSSFASSQESLSRPTRLVSYNSEEKNMSLPFEEEDEEELEVAQRMDDETLVMIFQWISHEAGDRFKHPLQASYGQNDESVSRDLWDRQVAHPIRQLQALGAKMSMHRLELRGVETGPESKSSGLPVSGRVGSGSRRLSVLASGLGERFSGFWR